MCFGHSWKLRLEAICLVDWLSYCTTTGGWVMIFMSSRRYFNHCISQVYSLSFSFLQHSALSFSLAHPLSNSHCDSNGDRWRLIKKEWWLRATTATKEEGGGSLYNKMFDLFSTFLLFFFIFTSFRFLFQLPLSFKRFFFFWLFVAHNRVHLGFLCCSLLVFLF